MKLRNILREMGDEENGLQSLSTNYDLTIQPSSTEEALNALNNIENYGIYAQNMRDPKTIVKIFGPSIPAQKSAASMKDWDIRSDEEKDVKIADIKKRVPEAWDETIEKTKDELEKWTAEGNKGGLEGYLKSITGKSLPMSFYGKFGKNYYPIKTPDNLKKYAGKLEKGVHYEVEGDNIVFPLERENPFDSRAYLEKVVKTILKNAGIKFDILKVEPTSNGATTTKQDTGTPLTTTLDTREQASKLRALFQSKLGAVKTLKFSIEPTEDGKFKLVVTGITSSQRSALLPIISDYKKEIETKLAKEKAKQDKLDKANAKNLKESEDLEMRSMLVRAGIIK